MQTLPQFKVLQRGEQPPDEGPDDLVSCLRQLADADLERLQSAVVNEVTRRGPPPGVALTIHSGRPLAPTQAKH